ncbi:hypothetical protein HETIRDRAFT_332070 [Heterobasidion irregulare TC 32-1]|uniref:Signal recognition particle subunit SRP72 n=1 Tax=Heterobasidion irregulare (strain TC 32-1) TaxID=747525 RepID=W4JMM2_HETIT|nr:uncharacterized protein HETIRDRAFT_332070 [Heterobasidion irregulare TC 32-1]ETW74729.1 hypothetical protein HETIRDRAFT_332070 [Heterobasidion irregulare TC 32-1]
MPPKPSGLLKKSVPSLKDVRKKASTKQPLPVSERLKRLFNSLCAQIDGGHFTNAVKTCDKILRLDPKDKDALQAKLFLLLQIEQYSAALTLLDSLGSSSEGAFEKAYSLYRLQRESEASQILNDIKQSNVDDRGVLHLEAQLSYRQGSYHAAFDLYNQLLDTADPQTEEHSDILTNLQASQRHLDFINTDYLRVLDQLPMSVTNSLETSQPPVHPTTSLLPLANAPSAEEKMTKPKLKKVRTRRVPAGVVPGVTPAPDPERWLKRTERSTFVQARSKRRGGGGGGATQGMVESGGASGAGGQSRSGGGNTKGKKKK